MGKYIDADKLIAEIERRKQVHFDDYFIKKSGNPADYGASNALAQILSFINSLHQEQPKVDLEKEIETYFKGWYMDETDQGYILHTPDDHAGLMSVKQIARHFYELGLNARKEE